MEVAGNQLTSYYGEDRPNDEMNILEWKKLK
jgi:hypothetical protein